MSDFNPVTSVGFPVEKFMGKSFGFFVKNQNELVWPVPVLIVFSCVCVCFQAVLGPKIDGGP